MTNLEYLKKAAALPVHNTRFAGSPFQELVRFELLAKGEKTPAADYGVLDTTLRWLNERIDCADFYLSALYLILRNHRGTERLPEAYAKKIEDSFLKFYFWLDEPEETNQCYFTENHQILFHSGEYLIGQMFPDKIFANGKDGKWHKEHALAYIRRWMDWRSSFGFSEWLADRYYCKDIEALLGLYYHADEADIRSQAKALVDMLMFDVAVNAKDGYLCTTHGRVYPLALVEPDEQGLTAVCALCWGEGCADIFSNAAALLAVYDYQVPEIIRQIALDKPPVMKNHERMSINVEDAKYYGVDPADFDNIMLFWGIQAFSHRQVIDQSLKVFPYWNWMVNRVKAYKEQYQRYDEAGVPSVSGTPDYTAMTQVDLHVYKTPDYALSCAQDFRKGTMGYQQHIWSAYLGGKAHVFTTVPGSNDYTARPNQLAGSLFLPRAVAHENVQLCIYRIKPEFVDYLYSHAYFPRDEFDEVVEEKGFVFGRRENAYIALRSLAPARWKPVDMKAFNAVFPDKKVEQSFDYMAPGHTNVWVCELGSKARSGSFESFRAGFGADALSGDSLAFQYASPSQGKMEFGWTKPLLVEGREINFHNYKRYDNMYCQAEFNSRKLAIRHGENELIIEL